MNSDKKNIIKSVVAFLLSAFLGLIITFFGLCLYFTDSRLQAQLTQSYSAEQFKVLAGQAKIDNDTLLVTSIMPDGYSSLDIDKLHIDSRFYEKLTVYFTEKHNSQPLLIMVRNNKTQSPEQYLLHGSELTVDLLIKDLAPVNTIITNTSLITDRIIAPYRIQSIAFFPKKLSYTEFAYLLADCFAINRQWNDSSINTHKSPYPVLIPPKILLLLYFTVVGLLFAIYLKLTKRPLINAGWVSLLLAWLTLDAHYLIEKTVITKNSYDTFAHLSDDERDLELSPETAKISQTIKSVLPNDGKRKKIRVQFGWNDKEWLWDSHKRYLNGKLHYMLQPNTIYTLGVKIPVGVWEKGGFYYVDVRKPSQRLIFDAVEEKLQIDNKIHIAAKRLLNRDDMVIYQVMGEEK